MNVSALSTRVECVEKWCESIDLEVKANTALTKQVHTNTEAIVELFQTSKEAVEFMSKWGRRIAVFAKYVSYIAGGITAVWALFNLRK